MVYIFFTIWFYRSTPTLAFKIWPRFELRETWLKGKLFRLNEEKKKEWSFPSSLGVQPRTNYMLQFPEGYWLVDAKGTNLELVYDLHG